MEKVYVAKHRYKYTPLSQPLQVLAMYALARGVLGH